MLYYTRFDVRGKPRGWARGALEVISTCKGIYKVKLIRHLRSKTTHFQFLVAKHNFWLEWLAALCAII